MIKNIIGGIAVGIANIIPGVSGGTMLVILGLFDRLMESISDIFRVESKNRKEAIIFLSQVLIGAGIGLVGFAKIIDLLFEHAPTQTFYWFIGLVLFSVPGLLKKELKGNTISPIAFFLGVGIIACIGYFSPEKTDLVITSFPSLSFVYMVELIIVGMIVGGTMLMPGVSGSLVLLIIGRYYIFKSYVANVTSFSVTVLVPLIAIAIGVGLGILISAKFTSYMLEKNRKVMVSIILGLVIASAIILIPFQVTYTVHTVLTSIIAFVLGAVVVKAIDKYM